MRRFTVHGLRITVHEHDPGSMYTFANEFGGVTPILTPEKTILSMVVQARKLYVPGGRLAKL